MALVSAHQGERYGEDGATLRPVAGVNLSAVHPHDPPGNGKAQPRSFACPRLVTPIKAIEDPG
jgi:hypothetical protein